MTIHRQTHFRAFPHYLAGEALALVFPPDQCAHVHAFYLHKRNVSAVACAEAVRLEFGRMILAIRKQREGLRNEQA